MLPLPPRLVALWRASVTAFGTADDGRLFFSERGGILSYSAYHWVWREARALALPPALSGTRSRSARTTCGTRRCPHGCARARTRPRSPSGRGTASRSC
ncbi:hypothetical protein [Streptomyces hawaiiensis]|uniref:hypothetical protein n=1 Tax=Streptomyces hawaiiensis TaxID=67305 RepID=UPI00365BB43B